MMRFDNSITLSSVFFYINLGLTRRGMLTAVLAVDYLALAILLSIIMLM